MVKERIVWVVVDDNDKEITKFRDPVRAINYARRYGYKVLPVRTSNTI